ncbi:nitrate reductase molybdenum cofactor assembly chaperone [Spirillospora sp. NPDC052269]
MIETAIRQAAALLLEYPDDHWHDTVRLVRDTLGPLADDRCAPLLAFCETALDVPLTEAAVRYVQTFDRTGRRTLHLTYYTDGDTRRRGASLAALKARFREHGHRPPDDQLPDHLPLLLEFAARSPGPGERLLLDHRAGLELLRIALRDHGGPYADVLDAVCATLPGPSPADRAAALALARTGPPAETVGLVPFGPATHTEEGTRR